MNAKTLFLLAALGGGLWFLMAKARENKAVSAAAEAPAQYTRSLQADLQKANAVEQKANDKVKEAEAAVKAVEAAGAE